MQQIRYFLALASSLNFTRAAEECHVSQPALTRAIQALEAELGGPLIRREGRLSHLTELGQRMQPLMQRCYDSALTAKSIARAVTKNEVAPLALGVSHSVNLEIFMAPIAELFRSFSGAQLRIAHGAGADVLKRLKEGGAELALAGPVEDAWERLDRWPLFTEGFELAMSLSHPLAKENEIDLAKLDGTPLFAQAGCECRRAIEGWFEERGAAYVAAHEVDTQHDTNALLTASSGVALVPESATQSAALRRAKLDGLSVTRTIYLYAVSGRQRSPSASAFVNLLRSADYSAIATDA
jgi:DNA-binding transcriptional LysR family regulator